MGHDELRAGLGARDRICRARLSSASAHGGGDQAQSEILRKLARQSALLAESRWRPVPPRRNHQAADARAYEVYKHSFGSQGPALLQALNILEQFDLQAMKHNSADYVHTVVEALKLAYADRDTYYADPEFVQVPGAGLLSKDYAKERAKLIDPKRASRSFIAGNPLPFDPKVKEWSYWVANIQDAAQPGQPLVDPEPVAGGDR